MFYLQSNDSTNLAKILITKKTKKQKIKVKMKIKMTQ
jgi:hypothetical protein